MREREGRAVRVYGGIFMRACWSVYNEELMGGEKEKESEVMLDGVWPEKTGRGREWREGGEGQTNKEEKKIATGKSQNHAKKQQSSMLVIWHNSLVKTGSIKKIKKPLCGIFHFKPE